MSNNDDANHHADEAAYNNNQAPLGGVVVVLDPRPERRLLRAGGSSSYLDVVIRVVESAHRAQPERPPVHIALVIDRSGSMSGTKVDTAKRAALAVLDGLSERDTAAVVVFDDVIDVVQAETPVTALVKAHVAAELARVDARGSTALYEGWLVGCRAIAAELPLATEASVEAYTGVRRAFLLTDGQANIGLAEPEALAHAAADVREAAHVSTSTFGIGIDYAEELLGPMAEAGGGQFYHLRTPQEIATTFISELEQVLGTLARDAHLEIEALPGIEVELVSAYAWRAGAPGTAGSGRWEAIVGDLLGGEERHIILRLHFPAAGAASGTLGAPDEQTVRMRLTWEDQAGSHATAWQRCAFRYAESDAAYDAEVRDETVLHYAAQHLSDSAQREAIRARKRGDLEHARSATRAAFSRLAALTLDDDAVLAEEIKSLKAMEDELEDAKPDLATMKERYYQSQLRSTSKRDLRGWRQKRDGQSASAQPSDANLDDLDDQDDQDDHASDGPNGPISGTPPSTGR
jgi:Ca-activated chloride channel family protein